VRRLDVFRVSKPLDASVSRVTVSINWVGFDREPMEVAEKQARDMLKLYGFSAVSVRAVRRGDKITLELSGESADVRKARRLFEG
jgi:hypothetical protein